MGCCTLRACCFLDEPTVWLDPQTRSSIWSYISALKRDEDITIFMTTHYMDEAEYCDRIAIMDHGGIVALDTPEALKASVAVDRVQIQTGDDDAAIAALRERFEIEATVAEGAVTFGVPGARTFVPRLFAELGQRSARSTCRGRRWMMCSCPTPARRSATLRSRGHRQAASDGQDDEPVTGVVHTVGVIAGRPMPGRAANMAAEGHPRGAAAMATETAPAKQQPRARRAVPERAMQSLACASPRAACEANCGRSASYGSES